MTDTTIRMAVPADLPQIMAIYNHAVRETTAIWNDTQVDLDNRERWYADRIGRGFPVLVAVTGPQVLGYASYGDWRAFDGYRGTVENSVYVAPDIQGRGVGRTLLQALVDDARAQGKHVMVAGIEAGNIGSIRLHEKLGFVEVARMEQVGQKFGRWLDLVFLQLRLDERPEPTA
jgi:L-amino acid N-acyltransferase YncA